VTPAADWIQALAEICKQTSQAAAAQRVGISTASISLLLRGAYTADTRHMETKVRALLMTETRSCPELGDIALTRCFEEQSAPYFPSPLRSVLYRACRSCTHRSSLEAS
jgi:hypothetical protein